VRRFHALQLRGQNGERIRDNTETVKLARDGHKTVVRLLRCSELGQ
jgi:hypothetical protein